MSCKKKTAAIISLYGNSNYGNKLQNYAVQEVLKSYGVDTVNIINTPCLNNKRVDHLEVIKFCIKGLARFVLLGDRITACVDPKDPTERKKNFLAFNEKINNSIHFFSFHKLSEFDKFDYYFVGSDQIWNPLYGGLSDLDLLTFATGKKVSISASFGIEEIPEKYWARIKQYISLFDAVSVREEAAKKTIYTIAQREDVQVLVDPTMMLQRDDWDKVIKKPAKLKDNSYFLCYFLGTENEKNKNIIQTLAKKNACEIVDLSNPDSDFYSCGPSEFVYLVKNAACVCTDSFHASVFSILYNRPFVVFNRNGKYNGMGSRITTLLSTFHLEDAQFSENQKEIVLNRDFSTANKVLEIERKKALLFIKNAMRD